MRAWENLEGGEGAVLVHILRDGDVSPLRIELDPLPTPHSLQATLGDGRPPDVQPAPRWRDLNVGAFVVPEKSASGRVGDAMLIEAPVEVDTADAIPEDEAERRAGGARGLEAAPRARVGDGGPRARARAHRSFVDVGDPARPTRQLSGQAARGFSVGGAVVGNSAASRAEARVCPGPGFERMAAVFARSHKSYCNA